MLSPEGLTKALKFFRPLKRIKPQKLDWDFTEKKSDTGGPLRAKLMDPDSHNLPVPELLAAPEPTDIAYDWDGNGEYSHDNNVNKEACDDEKELLQFQPRNEEEWEVYERVLPQFFTEEEVESMVSRARMKTVKNASELASEEMYREKEQKAIERDLEELAQKSQDPRVASRICQVLRLAYGSDANWHAAMPYILPKELQSNLLRECAKDLPATTVVKPKLLKRFKMPKKIRRLVEKKAYKAKGGCVADGR